MGKQRMAWLCAASVIGLAAGLVGGQAAAQTYVASDYTTYYQYDAMRRPLMKIGPDPDGSGPLKRKAEKTTYDTAGRVVRLDVGTTSNTTGSDFAISQTTLTRYDASGNKTQVHAFPGTAAASLTQTSYDGMNRAVCSAVRMNSGAFNDLYNASDRPDACALTTQGAQGPDRVTRTVFDLAGQTLQTIQAKGTSVERVYGAYSYTANGKQGTITDANENKTTLVYDGFDRLKFQYFPTTARKTEASSTTDYEEYGYDPSGNRVGWRRRDGAITGFGYDALNRMTAKEGPGFATVNYAYDLTGRPTSTHFYASGQGVTYTYDTAGRQRTETTFGRTLTYDHDKAGNRIYLRWPDNAFSSFAYQADNKLYWLGDGTNFGVNTNRDDLGRVASIGSTNRVSTHGYDPGNRLTSLQHVLPSSAASAVTLGFTYNSASQTISQSVSNSGYVWGATNISLAATADGLNRDAAIAAAGGYDGRQNLISDGSGRTFGYDGENRLTSMSGPANAALEYDPLGRLSKTTINGAVTQFLYSGDKLVAEYDGAGALLRRYAHGQGDDVPLIWLEGATVSAAAARYLLTDRQGSVIGVVNGSGVSIASYTYGPYGEPGDNWGAGSRFRYTGQIALPEMKLYHYKARVYDPARGWFLQTDPIGYEADLNLYAYVEGDPLNLADPTGECPICATSAIGAGGGAVAGLVGQVAADVISGKPSSASTYLGAIAGGAVGGAIFGATGNAVAAGAIGGAVSGAIGKGGDAAVGGAKGKAVAVATIKGAGWGAAVGAVTGGGGKYLAAGGKGAVAKAAQSTAVGKTVANNEKMTNMMMAKVAAGAKTTARTGYKMVGGQATSGAGSSVVGSTACTKSNKC